MTEQTTAKALISIWDELPALVGDTWSELEPGLERLLREFHAAEDEETRAEVSVRIQFLLELEAPDALHRLDDAIADIEAGASAPFDESSILHYRRSPLRGLGIVEPDEPDSTPYVTRYTDIACPRRVWVQEQRISLVVRLTVALPEYSADTEALSLLEDVPVRTRVTAPAFELLNDPEQETVIIPDTDSRPLVFDLRPQQAGHTEITLDFFQGGNPAGTATVDIEVTERQVGDVSEPRTGRILRAMPDAPPPDIMLYIRYERFQGQPSLSFELRKAGHVGREFRPVHLEADPAAQAARFYERLTTLTDQHDPTVDAVLNKTRVLPSEDIDRELKNFGQDLWKTLIPAELKEVYAKERGEWQGSTLLIVSDEPHIPWELVWPYAREWEDDDPWCVTTRLTRWLRRDAQGNGHDAPPPLLPLTAVACLAPTDSGLPAAQRERNFLRSLISQYDLADASPELPTRSAVFDLLEAGGYDWLHVAAHGTFYPETPDSDSAIWLQDKRPLTPGAIVGRAIEQHIWERRPAFVFNACHSGRQEWALTRLGGWANRLVSAGAGLFLAPLWTVSDSTALTFARSLYGELLAGSPVGDAVRAARHAARQAGDPTWLAYSVYAHPNARLVRN